ncbi:MAG: MATE family efflux transporter [Lachnospiraceae bacterium]
MSSENTKRNEITEGIIWKQLLIFFFPIVIGTLFQQLYNTVDAVIVGRFVGKTALASVGGSAAVLTYQVVMFFTNLANGAAVIISQYFGAKNFKKVHTALHTAFAFSIVVSIAISIIGYAATPWLLSVMKTPEDTMADSILYLRIYFLGIIFTLIYNIGSAIMRAVGDSKRPLYYLIVCCILNILLDVFFVVFLKLGIAGAAIATVLAQAASSLLVIRALMTSYDTMKLNLKGICFDVPVLKSELRIGLPGGIQTCMYGLTNIIIQTAINGFGTDTTAAWAAFGKMDLIFWAVSGALGVSVTTFAGQNYGAGKLDRVYKSVRTSLLMSLTLCGSILVILVAFARPLFVLFTTDANVISIGIYILMHIVPSYAIYIFVEIFTGALRGIGDVVIPTLITLGGVCLVRLPWILFVTPIHKELFTILVSYPIAWAATALLLIPYYFYRKKKLNTQWKII